jgi:hypothetical protein
MRKKLGITAMLGMKLREKLERDRAKLRIGAAQVSLEVAQEGLFVTAASWLVDIVKIVETVEGLEEELPEGLKEGMSFFAFVLAMVALNKQSQKQVEQEGKRGIESDEKPMGVTGDEVFSEDMHNKLISCCERNPYEVREFVRGIWDGEFKDEDSDALKAIMQKNKELFEVMRVVYQEPRNPETIKQLEGIVNSHAATVPRPI